MSQLIRTSVSMSATMDRAMRLLIQKHSYNGPSDLFQDFIRQQWRKEYGSFQVNFDAIEKQIAQDEADLVRRNKEAA